MNYLLETSLIICAILLCTNISGTNSIINGRDPKLNEVKYVVAVLGKGICSGGIIGNKHIITAAHCIAVDKNNKLLPTKVVTATNVSSNYNPEVSIVKYVKRAFLLNAYAKIKPLHDIAVLELSGSIEIDKHSDKLQKLDLPNPIKFYPVTYPNYDNKKYKAAGFGSYKVKFVPGKNGKLITKTSGGGRLQVANAIVLKASACTKVYGGTMENRMCTSIIEDPQRKTFQGYCAGDSGTPIVVDDRVIIGIEIAGGNCNNNVNPGIAIRTTLFMSFIQNAMNGIITSEMKVYNAY